MATWTLNRNFGENDFLFVALNDSAYADFQASRSMDCQSPMQVVTDSVSFGTRVKNFFFGK